MPRAMKALEKFLPSSYLARAALNVAGDATPKIENIRLLCSFMVRTNSGIDGFGFVIWPKGLSSYLFDVLRYRESQKLRAAMEGDGTLWELLLTTLNDDVLVQIFQHFDIFESSLAITRFCDAWRRASCDPPLWHTLDFSMLKSNYIKIHQPPYVYVATHSDNTLTNLLFVALNLSQGNTRTLIFHYNLYPNNHHFLYTAKRCPRVRRLVFLSWNRIKKIVMRKAIRGWKDLESMTMPSIDNPRYVFEEISVHCKNFRELKVMGRFHMWFAFSLVRFLPELKVLSLRCSRVDREALVFILDGLRHLEVLNISHCFLVEYTLPPPDENYKVVRNIDPFIREKASRLREFLTCMKKSCIMCQRTRNDEGLPWWYKYEEGIWKADEISSLAL